MHPHKGGWIERKTEKWVFAASQVEVLGYILSEQSVESDTKRMRCILKASLL